MKLFAGLLLVFLVGCTSAQFASSRVNDKFPARTPANQIELYRSVMPTKKFTEIGVANACCAPDVNSLIDLLREKAAANGGDALIGLEYRADGSATATVIRYQ